MTETKPGSATRPLPGIDAAVVDDEGNEIDDPSKQGLLVLRRPWPGMLRTLYQEDDRFVETYYGKFGETTYLVGDAARKDEDGYLWLLGRVDDVINVSGHRLSTAEIESAVVSYAKVAECAVIGQSDEDTGQAICAFVTLEGDLDGTDEIADEIREHVGDADLEDRAAQADHLDGRSAEDPLREDHAPSPAGHRRGPRARRRHDAARPGDHGAARGEGEGAPGERRGRIAPRPAPGARSRAWPDRSP